MSRSARGMSVAVPTRKRRGQMSHELNSYSCLSFVWHRHRHRSNHRRDGSRRRDSAGAAHDSPADHPSSTVSKCATAVLSDIDGAILPSRAI
jgi:hypothetical protein